jgi:hypothetical protein
MGNNNTYFFKLFLIADMLKVLDFSSKLMILSKNIIELSLD